MIETIRFVLAMIVAETHLGPMSVAWPGWQAVFAFYALSGYLITRVLNQRYGFSLRGTAAFVVNRVLRLWPAYLVVVGITLVAMNFYPLQAFFFSLTAPRTLLEQVTILTIVGQVGFDINYLIPLSRPAPTSWSLSIELVSYLVLAIFFARSGLRLLVLAAIGLAGILLSTAHCLANPSPYYGAYCFQNRYGVVQAGFIPMAAGGLVFFYGPPIGRFLSRYGIWIMAALLGCEILIAVNTFASMTVGPFIGAAAMVCLLAWRRDFKRPSATVDFIGRASYHLFIAHMSIAAILTFVFQIPNTSWAMFAASLAVALALSGFLVPLEWRLNTLRDRISAGSSASLARRALVGSSQA